jgi:hypothetical protein
MMGLLRLQGSCLWRASQQALGPVLAAACLALLVSVTDDLLA